MVRQLPSPNVFESESHTAQGKMGTSNVGNKSICLPVLSEAAYELVSNASAFRHYLKLRVAKHPEIFPPQMAAGFWFHDACQLKKTALHNHRMIW